MIYCYMETLYNNKKSIVYGSILLGTTVSFYLLKDKIRGIFNKSYLDIEENNFVEETDLTNEDLIKFYTEKIDELKLKIKNAEEIRNKYKNDLDNCENGNKNSTEDVFSEIQLENKRNLFVKQNKIYEQIKEETDKNIKELENKINELENYEYEKPPN